MIGVFEHRKGELFQNPPVEKQVPCPTIPIANIIPPTMSISSAPWRIPEKWRRRKDEIRAVLRRSAMCPTRRRKISALSTAEEIADQFKQITGSVALLTAVVSSIGLLVGGWA